LQSNPKFCAVRIESKTLIINIILHQFIQAMEKDIKKHGNHKDRNKIEFAILLIVVGGLFLAFNMELIPKMYKTIILSWQMLLIAIGVVMLTKKQFTSGVILLLVGGFFIIPRIEKVFPGALGGFNINIGTFWPILLILIGLIILFKKSGSKKDNNDSSSSQYNTKYEDSHEMPQNGSQAYNSKNNVDENVIFGGSEQIIFSDNFQGGEMNVLFGEIKLDLRKSTLASGGNYLECNAAFGSIIIYVPSHWKVNLKRESLFGAVQDKRNDFSSESHPDAPVLNIKGACIFGGIEIRN